MNETKQLSLLILKEWPVHEQLLCRLCALGGFGRLVGARVGACSAWSTLGNWLARLEQARVAAQAYVGVAMPWRSGCLGLEWAWGGWPRAQGGGLSGQLEQLDRALPRTLQVGGESE